MTDLFGQVWFDAGIPESDFSGSEPPLPGNYIIQLTGFEVGKSRRGNEEYVALDLKLVGVPKQFEHSWRDWRGFGTAPRAVAARRVCEKLGVAGERVETLTDLEAELERCVGGCYYARIVQRGDWRNLFVDEQMDPAAAVALTRR